MTLPVEVIAVLVAVIVVGFTWGFRNGDTLARTAIVIVSTYMLWATADWHTSSEPLHPVGPEVGLGGAAALTAAIVVLYRAPWAMPAIVVAGLVVLVGDLGRQVLDVVGL